MERTEHREQFFAEVRNDPYAHMLTQMLADVWVEGYQQALRDVGDPDQKPFRERRYQALAWLTSREDEARAETVIAMAALAPNAYKPPGR
jgi:hypothetical protein